MEGTTRGASSVPCRIRGGLRLGFCKSHGLGQLKFKLLRSSWSEEFT